MLHVLLVLILAIPNPVFKLPGPSGCADAGGVLQLLA